MTPETFLSQYGELVQGQNGVSNLRKLILSLAVRGKLVAHDPDDGSADALASLIMKNKQVFFNETTFRKPGLKTRISGAIEPFIIPSTWNWLTLGDVAYIVGGGTPQSGNGAYFAEHGIPWFTPADLSKNSNKFVERGRRDLSDLGLQKSSAQLMPAGAVLFSSRAPIGYVAITTFPSSTNQGFKSCIPYTDGMSEYIYYYLRSAVDFIENRASGTTFKEVSGKVVNDIPFPLPPLAEQKRIVARVDELMALCDELEQQQDQHVTLKREAARATLHHLVTAETEATRQHHWSILANKWGEWLDDLEIVRKFRIAVLDLAIRGRLSDQYENEAPTAVAFLQERRNNKSKTEKEKNTPQYDAIELFELPSGWEWAELGELVDFGPRNGYSPKPVGYETKAKSMTLSAITNGVFERNKSKYIDEEIPENSHLWIMPGDILIQRANSIDYVGVSAIYTGNDREFIYPDLIMRMTIAPEISNKYVHVALSSSIARTYFRQNATGTSGSMPKIKQSVVNSVPIPLPPIAEQKRIVAKVYELTALCAQLEEQVREGERLNEALLVSMVHHMVDGPTVPPGDGAPKRGPLNSAPDEAAPIKSRAKATGPAFIKASPQTKAKTSEKFKEAVLVGAVVQAFFDDGGEPLGNFRIQKSVYFARRHMGETALNEEFLRKAAGPYNPTMKYSGGIKIAKDKGYIREAKGRFGFGHISGPDVAELMTYADKYGDIKEAAAWVREKFKFKKNEDWEVLATVDYALMHLEAKDIPVAPTQILQYIAADDEWRPKLKKLDLSEAKVEKALVEVRALFG